MKAMNRRVVVAGATAPTLCLHRALAQEISKLSGTKATSDTSGAEVDLGRTGFTFHSRFYDEANDMEVLGFSTDTCDGSVRFLPTVVDPQTYLDERTSSLIDTMPAAEVIGDVANGWLEYPDQAGQFTAPAEYASLEGLYLT